MKMLADIVHSTYILFFSLPVLRHIADLMYKYNECKLDL